MISSTPEVAVLFACMRFYFHTATAREVTSLLTTDLKWETLVQIAIEHGVMPLLYQSLKAISILEGCANEGEYVPRSVRMQLRTLNRMNGLSNLSQTKELLKMLTALEKAGIEALSFKGPVLAASAYGDIALRQFSDLDILVRKQDFWRAKAILVNQGYQSVDPKAFEMERFNRHLQIALSRSTPEAMMFNQLFQTSFLHSNPERSIDLHWGISPRRIWQSARFERLWENFQSIELMGQPVKTFAPEAALVVQCINFAKEPWDRLLKHACDVAQIIQAHPNLNWHSALDLSSELRCQRLFLLGLYLTHSLMHVPLPQFILEKCFGSRPTNERTVGTSGILKCWWLEYTNQLKTIDRLWDGLFITGFYLQVLLQFLIGALFPNECDREFISLPNKLHFLYYTIRPIRLLIKYSTWRKSFVVENKP